jgi:hypothetical protein
MKCPSCTADLKQSDKCDLCGWEDKPQPKKPRVHDDADHRKICSYEYRGEKCQRLATMSHGTKGEGPWICADHFYGRRPGSAPGPAPKDWRDAEIDKRIKPEDYRQPGESRSAYRERMMSQIKVGLARVSRPLPYDKTTRLEADEERAAIQGE